MRPFPLAALAALGGCSIFGGCHIFSGYADLEFRRSDEPTTQEGLTQLGAAEFERVDVLLAIDNSRSMADKQAILKSAVADLVGQLVNPRCVTADGETAAQPDTANDPCPAGSARPFEPVIDLHVGVITSSIGGFGSDACSGEFEPSENDGGHLISRSSTEPNAESVDTYQDLGFLAWDPAQTASPPGDHDPEALAVKLSKIVAGAGEVGCGFEAPLEAWYRFLIQPDPHAELVIEGIDALPQGLDEVLLKQRAAFLRPDSLLAIINLTDENDCSIIESGMYYFAAQIYTPGSNNAFHLPPARAACAADPDDPCCKSCGQPAGDGCDESMDQCGAPLTEIDDKVNVRCFDQKRRFGIDFLYPTDRYVSGLTSPLVPDRDGNLVANPIFDDLDPNDASSGTRSPALVFFTSVVGVPWQDIARRDSNGNPDLVAGLDPGGKPTGGFQTGTEMLLNGTWDLILGDPQAKVPPTDPLMRESIEPRTGENPITQQATAPPGSSLLANPVNGHEYDIPGRDDLQYACIFPLADPRDCETESGGSCACSFDFEGNPLCQDSDGYSTTQHFAQAFPGRRQLQVVKELGAQGMVGSICPAQLDDEQAGNFGYRPALGVLADRLTGSLGQTYCLDEALPEQSGESSCVVIEARVADACECSEAARSKLEDAQLETVLAIKNGPTNLAGWNCFCAVDPATGADLDACRDSAAEPIVSEFGYAVNGWCYLDATAEPPLGNVEVAAVCPGEPRLLRFAGDAVPAAGAAAWLSCSD